MYGEVSLEEKDVEYLEAACLLHNIGLFTGKKGYHKQSFHIIMVCSTLASFISFEDFHWSEHGDINNYSR